MKLILTAATLAALALTAPAYAQTGGTPAVGTKTPSSATGSMSGNSNVQGSTSMANQGSTNTYGSVLAQGSGTMGAKTTKTSKAHSGVKVSSDSIDRSGKTQEGGRATAGAQTTQEQAFGAHTPSNRGSSNPN